MYNTIKYIYKYLRLRNKIIQVNRLKERSFSKYSKELHTFQVKIQIHNVSQALATFFSS